MEAGQRVCPRCGSPAGQDPFCSRCGLNLSELPSLPTRQEWEANQGGAYAQAQAAMPSPDQRRWLLEQVLAQEIKPWWKPLHRSEYEAIYCPQPHHTLHAILSVITLGLWLTAWLWTTVGARNERFGIRIDEHGWVYRLRGRQGQPWGWPQALPPGITPPPGLAIAAPPPAPGAFAAFDQARAERRAE